MRVMICRWCSEPIEECAPHEPGVFVHSDSGMSLCWDAPDGESAQPSELEST